jgi:hypothetical protein
MKKILIVILFILPCTAFAQRRAGLFMAYGTKPEKPAFGGNYEFFIDKKLSLSPSLLVYVEESTPTFRHFWMEVNFNGHYYAYTYGKFEFFALGGVNYTYHDYKDKVIRELSYRTGSFNLNFGGGVNFKISDRIMPFSEIRYAIGGTDQIVVAAGFRTQF